MLKPLFTHRLFQAGVIFFFLMAVGGTIYLARVKRQAVSTLERTRETVMQARQKSEHQPNDSGVPLIESEGSQTDESLGITKAPMHPQADALDVPHSQTVAPAGDPHAQLTSNHNPVPREVIEDSERDLEWIRADEVYQEKYRSLEAERDKLRQEGESLRPPPTAESIQRQLRMGEKEKEAHIAQLKAWLKKSKDLEERMKRLRQEKPIRPTPTHTH